MSRVIRRRITGKIRRIWISKEDVLNKAGIYHIPSMPRRRYLYIVYFVLYIPCMYWVRATQEYKTEGVNGTRRSTRSMQDH